MDLFEIIFNALSPYMFSVLKLALAITLFSAAIRLIRSRNGGANIPGGGNPYTNITTAFIGYLFGRGIPIIVRVIDAICDDILAKF